jgi:hypothetical protein
MDVVQKVIGWQEFGKGFVILVPFQSATVEISNEGVL